LIMHQLMWKYKVSQWNVRFVQRSPHGCAVPSFCFCKGQGSLRSHKTPKWCTQSPDQPHKWCTGVLIFKSIFKHNVSISLSTLLLFSRSSCFYTICSFACDHDQEVWSLPWLLAFTFIRPWLLIVTHKSPVNSRGAWSPPLQTNILIP